MGSPWKAPLTGRAWVLHGIAGSWPLPLPAVYPHIVFYREVLLLKHAASDGAQGVVESLGCTAASDDLIGMTVDGAGSVHVSYRDHATSDLFCAYLPSGQLPSTVRIAGASLHLSWVPSHGAWSYWVFGSPTEPFFLPGGPPGYANRIAVLPSGTTSWICPGGVGSPDEDRTYLIGASGFLVGTQRSMRRGGYLGHPSPSLIVRAVTRRER